MVKMGGVLELFQSRDTSDEDSSSSELFLTEDIFGALAERVAAAPDGSQLVEDLWNDFPHLMTSADDDAATMCVSCGCFH